MKKGIILNLKRFKILDYVTHNKIIIFLCLLFVTGMILSVTALSNENKLIDNAKSFLNEYILLHSNDKFFKKFITIFIRYIFVLIFYYFLGASMFGVVAIPFLTLWQGIWFGALTSQLYSTYGIYGVAFNAIILIPPTAIFVICCFIAAKHSIDYSLLVAKLTLPQAKPIILFNNFKKYCSTYLIITGVVIVTVLLEIVLNLFFLKFFNF